MDDVPFEQDTRAKQAANLNDQQIASKGMQ